jgi:hypothetical protein
MKIDNFKFVNGISKCLPSIAGQVFKEKVVDSVKTKDPKTLKNIENYMNFQGSLHLLIPLYSIMLYLSNHNKDYIDHSIRVADSINIVHGSSQLILAQRLKKIRKKIEVKKLVT